MDKIREILHNLLCREHGLNYEVRLDDTSDMNIDQAISAIKQTYLTEEEMMDIMEKHCEKNNGVILSIKTYQVAKALYKAQEDKR